MTESTYRSRRRCGWTSSEYGTKKAADDALARHQQYSGH
jgi:hypothetical protein